MQGEYSYRDRHETVGRVNVYAQLMQTRPTPPAASELGRGTRLFSQSPLGSRVLAPSPSASAMSIGGDLGYSTASANNLNGAGLGPGVHASPKRRLQC